MKPNLCVAVLATTTFICPASAHHSGAMFDRDTVVTLQGAVTGFEWSNPHVYIHVEGTDSAGEVAEWEIEADPTPLMMRNGWTATSIVPGDIVTVRMNPARNTQQTHARLISLVTNDGTVFNRRNDLSESSVAATSIAGVWDSIRGFATRDMGEPIPTPAGAPWQASFTYADSPLAQCVDFVAPFAMILPYLLKSRLWTTGSSSPASFTARSGPCSWTVAIIRKMENRRCRAIPLVGGKEKR